MSEKIHDAEQRAAQRALEAAAKAFRSAQYDPAPYTVGMARLRKIDPAQFRTDKEPEQ